MQKEPSFFPQLTETSGIMKCYISPPTDLWGGWKPNTTSVTQKAWCIVWSMKMPHNCANCTHEYTGSCCKMHLSCSIMHLSFTPALGHWSLFLCVVQWNWTRLSINCLTGHQLCALTAGKRTFLYNNTIETPSHSVFLCLYVPTPVDTSLHK